MIRPFTLITALLAAGSGAYLFAVKHHAQMLDDQIADVSQQSRLDAQRIRVLQAQWSLETDPTRLQQLSAQFTSLKPMQPDQLVTLTALKSSLPAPGSAAPGVNPELPGMVPPAVDEAVASNAFGAPQFAGGLPLPPPAAPPPAAPPQAQMAAVAAAPVPAMMAANAVAKPVFSLAPKPRVARHASHSALAGTQLAEALPPPRVFDAPRVFSAPGPVGGQVVSVKAVPQYAAAPDSSGSVLGMAANLPPPQPLPQNGN